MAALMLSQVSERFDQDDCRMPAVSDSGSQVFRAARKSLARGNYNNWLAEICNAFGRLSGLVLHVYHNYLGPGVEARWFV